MEKTMHVRHAFLVLLFTPELFKLRHRNPKTAYFWSLYFKSTSANLVTGYFRTYFAICMHEKDRNSHEVPYYSHKLSFDETFNDLAFVEASNVKF